MRRHLLAAAAAALTISGAARAADLPSVSAPLQPVESAPEVTFAIAPYLWGISMNGKLAQFGLPTVEVDASFSDILSNLDFAAMLLGEVRYNRLSLLSDFNYSKLSIDRATPLGILATSAGVSSEMLRWSLFGGYEVLSNETFTVDVLAGAQMMSVETKLSFTGGFLGGVSRTDSDTWFDALGGARARVSLTPQVYLTGWGLIGAGQSDLVWDVMGGVGYSFNDSISAVAGYRALSVDYQDGGFRFDVVQHGPIVGGVFRF